MLKSGKLAESVLISQADVLTRQVATEALSSNDSEASFQDLGHNADLYIFNQDDRQDHAFLSFAYFGLVLMKYNINIQVTMRSW